MDSKKQELLEKIRKLLALGDKNRNNSIHEAETAMAFAKKLMAQYNISMSEVDVQNLKNEKTDKIDAVTKRSFSHWEQNMMFVARYLFDVGFYFHKKMVMGKVQTSVIFYGLAEDAAMAGEVFKILCRMANDMSREYSTCSEGNSYRVGLSEALVRRAKKMADGLTQEEQSKCTGLMVIKNQIVEKMKADMNIKTRSARAGKVLSDPYYKGLADGKHVNLNFNKALQ